MPSFITKLAVLILMAACQSAFAADAGRTLLVIGDSLSAGFGLEPGQGWVALLQDRLEAEGYGYRVVNASITGDTTTGGVGRLPRALQLHRPAVVVIELGGNDGLRGTPIPVIRDNMAEMIRLAQQAQARVVLAGLKMPPNYGERYTSAFEAMYAELAARHGVALIDFFMDGVALNPRFMQPDGIHPNAAGQARLLENAWPVIEKQLRATSGRH
ncbi:MAG: hypothetical protein AMXMBFR8_10240 [Nevskiales bacterium]